MATTCRELFADTDCAILGNEDELVYGIAFSSNAVREGDAFFCVVGTTVDGHRFAGDAVSRGAKVLVVERELSEYELGEGVTAKVEAAGAGSADAENAPVESAPTRSVTQVVVPDTRAAMALAAAAFHGKPSQSFELVGITGTNGKTTTAYLVEHIAAFAGRKTGLIGTVGVRIGEHTEKSAHTTPESADLQATFARMRDAGVQTAVMEVSSHALHLKRTWGTHYSVVAFSNLTQDHLDYHETFEDYFEAKALLFSADYPAKRVVCIDDSFGLKLRDRCLAAGDSVITTGFHADASVRAVDAHYTLDGTNIELEVHGKRVAFHCPLVGSFNVENIMLAFGIGLQLGFTPELLAEALECAPQIPGRLERVRAKDAEVAACASDAACPAVYVDYAHTPDALEKALAAMRAISEGELTVVFGCGGDRDATKRPIMGRAALAADYAVVTSDNPRSEDPNAIIADIVAGMQGEEDRFEVEPDRRAAIALALQRTPAGGAVLIAGKGHEDYQLVGGKVLSFDDRIVAAEELTKLIAAAPMQAREGAQ